MPKSPNPDIINKIYFRNIYSCQRKIYWYKVKVMETINAVWEHSYGEDCIPNFSANMEQPRHRWYEFKEGFSLTLVERAIRETKNWKALNYTGANLRDTFKANALQMISDLERSPLLEGTRDITQGDTRKLLQASEHDSADLIIFSPPYLNSLFDFPLL